MIENVATRWGSTYDMLDRYSKLREFISRDIPGISDLMLTDNEFVQVKDLVKELKQLRIRVSCMQDESLSLFDASEYFEFLMDKYPETRRRLSPDSTLVKFPDFHNGVVKLQRRKRTRNLNFTATERRALKLKLIECFVL